MDRFQCAFKSRAGAAKLAIRNRAAHVTTLLALDTASERMTIALRDGERVVGRTGPAGAQASATLIPAILALLDDAGVPLGRLDAIAFGRGPGAFTGLRTACAVAQGLALGAGKPVLAIDNLLAVAEDARDGASSFSVWSLLDARMDQIYAADYAFADGRWTTLRAPMLTDPAALATLWHAAPPAAVAGDALAVFGAALATGGARRYPEARLTPAALLALAERAWRDSAALDPADALPVYVRDRVALTTRERAAARAAKEAR